MPDFIQKTMMYQALWSFGREIVFSDISNQHVALSTGQDVNVYEIGEPSVFDICDYKLVFSTRTIALAVRLTDSLYWCRIAGMVLDNEFVWVALKEGHVRVWNWQTGEKLRAPKRIDNRLPMNMVKHCGYVHVYWNDGEVSVFTVFMNGIVQVYNMVPILFKQIVTLDDPAYYLGFNNSTLNVWPKEPGSGRQLQLMFENLKFSAATIAFFDNTLQLYTAVANNNNGVVLSRINLDLTVNDTSLGATDKKHAVCYQNVRIADMTIFRDTLAVVFSSFHSPSITLFSKRDFKPLKRLPFYPSGSGFERLTVFHSGSVHETLMISNGRCSVMMAKPSWAFHNRSIEAMILSHKRAGFFFPSELITYMLQFL